MLQRRIDRLEQDVAYLARQVDKLAACLRAIQRSMAWRLGWRVVSLLKKLLGKPVGSPIFLDVDASMEHYAHWKISRD
jgi:hypothetical protein